MIISVSELMAMDEFKSLSESTLQRKLDALEALIRSYTHNNFQVITARFEGASEGNMVYGYNAYLKAGDTVQITQSPNEGLYVISAIAEDGIQLDGELYSEDSNLVTKVSYPADVIEGVINLMKWEVENRDKVGVKSETLSRHSVTYYDQDANNTVMGYPVSLMGFLKPYMKARF